MDTLSGSTRKSTMNEPDEDQERHESKRLGLVGGLDASADTMDCLYLDEDVCGKINATTAHEISAMIAVTEVENIQQWQANLLPEKVVHSTKSGKIWIL